MKKVGFLRLDSHWLFLFILWSSVDRFSKFTFLSLLSAWDFVPSLPWETWRKLLVLNIGPPSSGCCGPLGSEPVNGLHISLPLLSLCSSFKNTNINSLKNLWSAVNKCKIDQDMKLLHFKYKTQQAVKETERMAEIVANYAIDEGWTSRICKEPKKLSNSGAKTPVIKRAKKINSLFQRIKLVWSTDSWNVIEDNVASTKCKQITMSFHLITLGMAIIQKQKQKQKHSYIFYGLLLARGCGRRYTAPLLVAM